MKTLICIPCLLTGGTEIQTLNTVQALVQGGHEVTVACYFEHTPDMVARYRKAGAEVILFSPEGIRVGGYKSILFLYRHLRRAVRAVRPDVVHVQYMAPGATVILLLWLMGVKNIIATAHTAADIYRDLRLIHFLQRHCLRAFTCITERAEHSFFGTSQLYTADMLLGRRNHFTIYNALPKATVLQTTDNGQRTRFVPMSENQVRLNSHSECSQSSTTKLLTDSHPEENTKHSTLNAKQENSHADFTDYTENASLAGNINLTQTSQNSRNNVSEQDNQRELDTITQNTHCYARVGHPDGDTKHYTLNTAQENSHADYTDYTENASLAGNINLTQTSQNSRNNISEQDNQRELDTITQNTHCYARVGHPDGDTKLSTLNAKQENSHTDFTDYTDSISCQRASQRATCKFTCDFSASAASEDVNQQNLDAITQNLQVASPLLASGAHTHPEGNSTPYTLNSTQEKSHTEYTESTESKSLRPCCHPDGDTKHYTLNSKHNTIGVVSRLEPIKGMDLVVPAFAEVLKAYPETQLLVVGDGTLRAFMEEQAAQLACADHIRFVGRQPQEELSQWYSQMDIVLMPSRSEGFGLTAIEAMAHSCVMVASDVGGLPEVVRDGICGLLHRTEDVADMASKISTLIGDPALYTQLRAQSLVEVEKYSFDRYAALMNDLYNKLGR